ncbi:hypothetical protein DL767_008391 [Monosporascus sp. MG133]|nr:hypothetical protein DL767_008391 [Monosporascus sp. MG133]
MLTTLSDLPELEPEPASLPRTPEEVITSWLSSILGHKVKAIEMTKAIHTTASKLFFTIRYQDGIAKGESRPTHICIKGVQSGPIGRVSFLREDLPARELFLL